MSLVKCPECGRENVSDKAEACPSCGFALKDYYSNYSSENDSVLCNYEKDENNNAEMNLIEESFNDYALDNSENNSNNIETEKTSDTDVNILEESDSKEDDEKIISQAVDTVIANPMFSYSRDEVRKMTGNDLLNAIRLINDNFIGLSKIWDEKIDLEEKIAYFEKNRAKAIRKLPGGWWAFVWISTIIVSIILTMAMPLFILASPVVFFVFWFTARWYFGMSSETKRIAKYDAKNIEPLSSRLGVVIENEDKYLSKPETIWSLNILGSDLFCSGASNALLSILETGRADNYKEALKVYDEMNHRNYMENAQNEIKLEAQKTSSYAQTAAIASTVSAVSSYATYRNSKRKK